MSLEIEEVSFRIKVLVLLDIIKFFQRKQSRSDEPDTKEEILEGIFQDHRIDDPGETDPEVHPFSSLHTSCLITPIDLVLSVDFLLTFSAFSSYDTHWSQEC